MSAESRGSPFPLEEALRRHRAAIGQLPSWFLPDEWTEIVAIQQTAGAWIVWHTRYGDVCHPRAIAVTSRGCYVLWGALGKLFFMHGEALGVPLTNERWLGSGPGRYQLFDRGIGVWDRGYVKDLGYPRFLEPGWRSGRACAVMVAVFDLRSFTSTSDSRDPAEVQAIIEDLEVVFQDAFAEKCWASVFVKGTGDGLIVISEGSHFRPTETGQVGTSGLQYGHAAAFVTACQDVILGFAKLRPEGPPIGCGIDAGSVTQVFLLGQSDYLGPAINHAAKIQQGAVKEVRMSAIARDWLASDGPRGAELAAATRDTGEAGVLRMAAG